MQTDRDSSPDFTTAVIDRGSIGVAIRLLRATVVEPWESVDQLIADVGQRDLGDPLAAGTGAWHLRHIAEIFRLHARTVMIGLGDARRAQTIAPPEAPIPLTRPWSAQAARDELLADLDRFCTWLLEQDEAVLSQPFTYGSPTNLTTMFSVMLQHITWHAAAVHYWSRWKGDLRDGYAGASRGGK